MRTKKTVHRLFKTYQKEKKRCAKLYPDWNDDDYNALDNKFIWGVTEELSAEASFATNNIVTIYYNRSNKKYYLSIDVTGFTTPLSKTTALQNACIKALDLVDPLTEEQYCALLDKMYFDIDFYCCDSVEEAVFKLKMLS